MLASDPHFERTPVTSAIVLLEQLPAHRLGVAADASITLAEPIAKFRIEPNAIRSHANITETAYQWGWRFFIVAEGALLSRAIDVRPGRNAGRWRAGLASGDQLAKQLTLIDRLYRTDALTGSLRLLDAPGLDWSGLWVLGEGEQQLISLAHGRSIDAPRLMARLRRTARRQHDAALVRARHERLPELNEGEGGLSCVPGR